MWSTAKNRRLVLPSIACDHAYARVALGLPARSKNVDDALPYRFAVEALVNRDRLDKRSRAAVLDFDGAFEFVRG